MYSRFRTIWPEMFRQPRGRVLLLFTEVNVAHNVTRVYKYPENSKREVQDTRTYVGWLELV